jgi:hypothetical protein
MNTRRNVLECFTVKRGEAHNVGIPRYTRIFIIIIIIIIIIIYYYYYYK